MSARNAAVCWWYRQQVQARRLAYLANCVAMDERDGGARVAALLSRPARESAGVALEVRR